MMGEKVIIVQFVKKSKYVSHSVFHQLKKKEKKKKRKKKEKEEKIKTMELLWGISHDRGGHLFPFLNKNFDLKYKTWLGGGSYNILHRYTTWKYKFQSQNLLINVIFFKLLLFIGNITFLMDRVWPSKCNISN